MVVLAEGDWVMCTRARANQAHCGAGVLRGRPGRRFPAVSAAAGVRGAVPSGSGFCGVENS